jgi:hypothetical protein
VPESKLKSEPQTGSQEEVDLADYVNQVRADEAEKRAWIRTLMPFVETRPVVDDADVNPRVQYALDIAYVAALERIRRICRSDIHPYQDEPVEDES